MIKIMKIKILSSTNNFSAMKIIKKKSISILIKRNKLLNKKFLINRKLKNKSKIYSKKINSVKKING
jgi:hypothetical protein